VRQIHHERRGEDVDVFNKRVFLIKKPLGIPLALDIGLKESDGDCPDALIVGIAARAFSVRNAEAPLFILG